MGLGALSVVARSARLALDLLLPPQCMGCNALVDVPGQLCAACWRRLDFLTPPCCACCGLPFSVDLGPGTLCGECMRATPPFGRARAVLIYDAASRPLIVGFKHGDRTERAPAFGVWLARAAADLLPRADAVAPVPLHRWRLLARRYNQAALLAQALARGSGKPVVPDLLLRRRATPSQGGLSRGQRRLNVAGAFAVRPRWTDWLADKRILLVDDVMTTGATVSACSRALLQAGAAGVDVVALARVVAEADPAI
jgi:ComF family protein